MCLFSSSTELSNGEDCDYKLSEYQDTLPEHQLNKYLSELTWFRGPMLFEGCVRDVGRTQSTGRHKLTRSSQPVKGDTFVFYKNVYVVKFIGTLDIGS